jgi:hypothetical protein
MRFVSTRLNWLNLGEKANTVKNLAEKNRKIFHTSMDFIDFGFKN